MLTYIEKHCVLVPETDGCFNLMYVARMML